MSPIIGLLIAVVAGLLAPRPRTAAIIVILPMLAATAAQSWYLGTGRGHNPASTTTDSPAYWVVQVFIVVAVCGVAAATCWIRMRRATAVRALPSSGWGVVLLVVATIAALVATLGFAFMTDRPEHPGSGNGNIPIAGAVAFVVGVVVLVFLAGTWFRNSRRTVAV